MCVCVYGEARKEEERGGKWEGERECASMRAKTIEREIVRKRERTREENESAREQAQE